MRAPGVRRTIAHLSGPARFQFVAKLIAFTMAFAWGARTQAQTEVFSNITLEPGQYHKLPDGSILVRPDDWYDALRYLHHFGGDIGGVAWRIQQGDFTAEFARQAFEHFALYGSVTTYSSCSNFNGATLTVPFGFYRGSEIVGMSAASDNRASQTPQEFHVNFSQFGNGWFFEPNGLLIGEVTVFDPQVVNSGIYSAPYNVKCNSVKRYRYLGANSAS